MSIEPFIKCSDLSTSLAFYTKTLDFVVRVAPDPDPEAFMSKYSLIERDGDLVHLSSHAGDGVFGSLIYIRVNDLDSLYERFVDRGLSTQDSGESPRVSIKPVEQTWGMKEFGVLDPDGNKLTFGQQIS